MPPLAVAEKVDLAKRHLLKSLEVKGERVGVLEMRRHLSAYFKSLPDFKPIRMKLVTEDNHMELLNILDQIKEKYPANENFSD